MTCSIKGCQNIIYCKGLCGKHYKRQWRHGNPQQTAFWQKEQGILCAAPYCANFVRRNGYCNACSARIRRHGTPELLIDGSRENNNYNNQNHRVKAAIVLGSALPEKVVVHHHNGTPSTLVICPNTAYHMLIHARMRRFKRGLPLNQPGRL